MVPTFPSGSRSALVNMEAKGEGASMLSRKCVVVQWKDLSSEKFLDLVQRGAGSLLVILPLVDGAIEEETTTVCEPARCQYWTRIP